MEKPESNWKKTGGWKNRYSRVYGAQRVSITKKQKEEEEEPGSRRISFMTKESTPYSDLLTRVRANRRDSSSTSSPSPRYLTSMLAQQSDSYGTYCGTGSMLSNDLGGHDTLLLDMVRAQSQEMQREAQDQTLELPSDDISDDQSIEACIHGLSMRMTDHSMSRSRVSRLSTRRDMDIPSILAFKTTTTAPVQLEIPAFKMNKTGQREEIPRWSIRRAVCPVCSQKWRDKSSITKIKYSGLKRNASSELPSVIAPARLRAAITMGYVPRPVIAAVDREAGVTHGGLRNNSATWQLTRARRFRTPKLQMPSPEATAPPTAAAPLAQRDLDKRVNRFLTDMQVKQFVDLKR